MRRWKKRNEDRFDYDIITGGFKKRDIFQYSFTGPLSMSKGCDEAMEVDNPNTDLNDYIYRGSNVAVATDATCYMDWIADQFNLKLEKEYERKTSCFTPSGDRKDIDRRDRTCW